MNTPELERALSAFRSGNEAAFGTPISVEEALRIRNAGNLSDEDERTLRLVLLVDREPLDKKRLRYEPDYHRAPEWRREGSRPVNVVPLRTADAPPPDAGPWWESPRVEELEEEWRRSGTVAGFDVPAAYRSFVFKTVIALQDAGDDVTPSSVADSVARWVSPEDAETIRNALTKKGPDE